ncbi:hypothetical protein L249_7850 [Ophiocordyceps polyrhachis-furcata BCC 54312]|uniref:Zinc/iron permease n=1 Tax=Ophiocordyceps polyrhachis-furcata BCC 54312 TaxID=1330021 RepID=A0A367L0J4_9HYPO|nr:hypothetical protein L249_7850 [Ophiocordyceps polyrhachis-furcata BCC 54312]
MICLNKADDVSSTHLAFNQSPPALSPSRTTRQDLNGISNLRQYVEAGQDTASSPGLVGNATDDDLHPLRRPPAPSCHGLTSFEIDSGRERRFCLSWLSSLPHHPERLWTLTAWILSLLFLYYLLPILAGFFNSGNHLLPGPYVAPAAAAAPARAPLAKRATCHVGGVDQTEYNTSLHVAALLIIWFVSTLGCSFPIMAAKLPWLRIPRRFFFAVRHFGTGVLIATAFVHLLPTAFISLGNPCLGSFWTEKYPAMPGAIALASIFLVTVIEMLLHPSRHAHPPDHSTGEDGMRPAQYLCSGTAGLPFSDLKGSRSARSTTLALGMTRLKNSPVMESEAAEIENGQPSRENEAESEPKSGPADSGGAGSTDAGLVSPDLLRRKERLQCILLEMGILFHSVFIGMAVSVSVGADFVVLLIAIVFHQTFEGLALGARISAIEWGSKKWQPWCMALAYGCTTPLGQAIGLATHTLYSPDSEIGLIVVGVMNAVSAGLLTFASLVELLSEDFLSDQSWRDLRGKQRIIACVLVFFGAFFMSLVGAWA